MAMTYNVADYGTKPNEQTNSTKAFLSARVAACGSTKPATIYMPAGWFFISPAIFYGPCSNEAIVVHIDGTLVAPSGYTSSTLWLSFKYVKGLSIFDGTLDGQGQAFWSCKKAGNSYPAGANAYRNVNCYRKCN